MSSRGGRYEDSTHNREVWRAAVPALNVWERVTASAAWTGRFYSCIESWDGKLWVICGNGPETIGGAGGKNLGDIWNSSDAGLTWVNTGLTIPKRHAAASCVWNNRIIITGGSGDDHRKNDVWVIEIV